MFKAYITSEVTEEESYYYMTVEYVSPQFAVHFSMEDLEAMFNSKLYGRGESNGYGRCRIYDNTLEVDVEKAGSGFGGSLSVTIDLSDDATKESLDEVIEQWKAISESHIVC